MVRKKIDLKLLADHAMEERGFRTRFSEEALEEIKQLEKQEDKKNELHLYKDLSKLFWSSIDNEDSLDMDQLEYVEKEKEGYRVWVAIADVDYYVKRGTAIDAHATCNTTSVYTGVKTYTMIPEQLCYNKSSLQLGQKRRAVVVEMFISNNGEISQEKIYLALVCNQAQLNYKEVSEFFEKGIVSNSVINNEKLQKQLLLQEELTSLLKEIRSKRGALEIETIEAQPIIKTKQVVSLEVIKKNRARELIEDLMIATNTTIALFFSNNKIPSIRRIVKTPLRWPRIVTLARTYRKELPDSPSSFALAKFMKAVHQEYPEQFPDISLTIVKLLGTGEYVVETPEKDTEGHFALAVQDYTHSTAPNRRYADLITQRILKAVLLQEQLPYSEADLQFLTRQCTERSSEAQKIERFVRKAAAAVLLGRRIGAIFSAIVTGASSKGTYVRLLNIPVEGKIVEGEKGLDVGERIKVKLLRVNPHLGHIDFVVF